MCSADFKFAEYNMKRCLWIMIGVVVIYFGTTRVMLYNTLHKTLLTVQSDMMSMNIESVNLDTPREDICLIKKEPQQTKLIYNMVPKCGSLGFRELIYSRKKVNHFYTIGLNYGNPEHIIKPYHLSENGVQYIIQKQFLHKKEPWLFYGHLDYINFTAAGYPMNPSYINIVRDPIERLVSFYYYRRENNMRYAPPLRYLIEQDTESRLKRKNMNFNDCVKSKDMECADPRFIFSMIPHFCGQDPMCIMPSECALAQAKRNAMSAFAVIGYLENYEQFIEVVEYMFPQYFQGALQMYHKISDNPDVRHKSVTRVDVSNEAKSVLMQRKDIQLEYEFYKFAKQLFDLKYSTLNTCRKGKK